jgi:hypothetical protein
MDSKEERDCFEKFKLDFSKLDRRATLKSDGFCFVDMTPCRIENGEITHFCHRSKIYQKIKRKITRIGLCSCQPRIALINLKKLLENE